MPDLSNDPSDADIPETNEDAEVESSSNASESQSSPNAGDESNEGEATHNKTPNEAPSSSSASEIGLEEAQNRAKEAAADLLEHEFEGIIKVEKANTGWRTVAEFVERRAVPDTQDIIGRYEIVLDAAGDVTGYELLERYRRGQMKEEL